MTSYFMAVVASCSAGAAVRYAAKEMTAKASGGRLLVLNGIVSTVACAGGGFANNWFIRQPEVKTGIAIRDPVTNEIVGVSKNCAKSAVWQTASS